MSNSSPEKIHLTKLEKTSSADLYTIIYEWWQHLKEEKAYSNNTITSYLSDISSFISFLFSYNSTQVSEKTLANSTVSDFRAYLSHISTERGANSRGRTLSSIRSLYNFCDREGYFKNEDIFLIKRPKKPKKLPRALNVESTLEAINKIGTMEYTKKNAEGWVALRDEALLLLIYSCGLRISEALSLKVRDLQNQSYIRVLGKGNKERLVPILEPTHKKLQELISTCPFIDATYSESYLFFGKQGGRLNPAVFQRLVAQVKNSLGLPEDTTPHAFRHSFATHLLTNSGDLRSIQELLGHASLNSTQIYTKIDASNLLKNFNKYS